MAAPDVKQLLELDLEARLELVAELWDSIVEEAGAGAELPLSSDERALLDARVREDDEDPDAAIPWDGTQTQLRSR